MWNSEISKSFRNFFYCILKLLVVQAGINFSWQNFEPMLWSKSRRLLFENQSWVEAPKVDKACGEPAISIRDEGSKERAVEVALCHSPEGGGAGHGLQTASYQQGQRRVKARRGQRALHYEKWLRA